MTSWVGIHPVLPPFDAHKNLLPRQEETALLKAPIPPGGASALHHVRIVSDSAALEEALIRQPLVYPLASFDGVGQRPMLM